MIEARRQSPEEIEREIARTRAGIDRTLTALQDRLSPAAIVDRSFRSMVGGSGAFAAGLGRVVRDNPIPFTLLGISVAWLIVAGQRRNGTAQHTAEQGLAEKVAAAEIAKTAAGSRDRGSEGKLRMGVDRKAESVAKVARTMTKPPNVEAKEGETRLNPGPVGRSQASATPSHSSDPMRLRSTATGSGIGEDKR